MIEVVVHGGGYVGLTGAVHFARAGLKVLVYDPDKSVCDAINRGEPKAGEFLGYFEQEIRQTSADSLAEWTPIRWGDNLHATHDITHTYDAPVHVVAVPSEKDGEPFDEIVLSVLQQIFSEAKPKLVIIESTCTPGTVDKFLQAGHHRPVITDDVHLAVAPRRDWFADPSKNLETLTRIVGGVTPACTELAAAFLCQVSKDIRKTDYRTAELTKPLENAFLHVAVSLANEMATLYPTRDTAQAVELACTHWRLMPVHQNIGIGGRCVPLGPRYLREGSAESPWMLTGSIATESVLCDVAARAISQRIKPGGRVLVLGIAYRPGFKDAGSSPGLALAHKLWREGFRVSVADPMWPWPELQEMTRLPAVGMTPQPMGALTLLECEVDKFDALVLATPHKEFDTLLDSLTSEDAGQVKFVLDAQGAWVSRRSSFAKGIEYKRVGDPGWVS